jgi:hypothetical protein
MHTLIFILVLHINVLRSAPTQRTRGDTAEFMSAEWTHLMFKMDCPAEDALTMPWWGWFLRHTGCM